jgi:hypothetical protein
MATPDGITTEDWDRVHDLALEVVNLSAEGDEAGSDAAKIQLRELLDDLQEKYGPLPSLLATRADYVERVEDRDSRTSGRHEATSPSSERTTPTGVRDSPLPLPSTIGSPASERPTSTPPCITEWLCMALHARDAASLFGRPGQPSALRADIGTTCETNVSIKHGALPRFAWGEVPWLSVPDCPGFVCAGPSGGPARGAATAASGSGSHSRGASGGARRCDAAPPCSTEAE